MGYSESSSLTPAHAGAVAKNDQNMHAIVKCSLTRGPNLLINIRFKLWVLNGSVCDSPDRG
jgi:hypothetical protein